MPEARKLSKKSYVCVSYMIEAMKKILFAFVLLFVAAGVQAQKIHPDISSVSVKATVDPSPIRLLPSTPITAAEYPSRDPTSELRAYPTMSKENS